MKSLTKISGINKCTDLFRHFMYTCISACGHVAVNAGLTAAGSLDVSAAVLRSSIKASRSVSVVFFSNYRQKMAFCNTV